MKRPSLPTTQELELIEALEPILRQIESGSVTVDEIMLGLYAAANGTFPETYIHTMQ